jgi:hypothetical protein
MSKASPAPRETSCVASKLPRKTRPRKKSITIPRAIRDQDGEGPLNKHWRTYFLTALIETSNVTASAEVAGISPSRAYRVRREDENFAAQWRVALREGYDNLEMELLGYLRSGDPARKMDVTNGIRLLSQHRATVAHDRALEDNCSEREVLESIDAMIDDMRARAAANAAILAEADTDTADPDAQ